MIIIIKLRLIYVTGRRDGDENAFLGRGGLADGGGRYQRDEDHPAQDRHSKAVVDHLVGAEVEKERKNGRTAGTVGWPGGSVGRVGKERASLLSYRAAGGVRRAKESGV